MTIEKEAVKEIADLAQQAGGIQIINIVEPSIRSGSIPFAAVPVAGGGLSFQPIKSHLDAWRSAPERIAGTAKVGTLASFIDLVNRHKNESSALFADLDIGAPSFLAVIDYHTTGHEPRFSNHRIAYKFPVTPEWQAWQAMNGKSMSQGDWAAFVEEHVADLASPLDAEKSEFERLFQTSIAAPSDLIQLSRGMQISVEARVKEVRTLQSGEAEIVYEEVHKDGSGAKLVVPGLFVINIPLFQGGEKTRILARLRYRRNDSKIVWFYQMYRADLAVRAYLEEALAGAAAETSLPAYEASPESP
jgi:uncharacterized protein YfdQ (DUF2303 family)